MPDDFQPMTDEELREILDNPRLAAVLNVTIATDLARTALMLRDERSTLRELVVDLRSELMLSERASLPLAARALEHAGRALGLEDR